MPPKPTCNHDKAEPINNRKLQKSRERKYCPGKNWDVYLCPECGRLVNFESDLVDPTMTAEDIANWIDAILKERIRVIIVAAENAQ